MSVLSRSGLPFRRKGETSRSNARLQREFTRMRPRFDREVGLRFVAVLVLLAAVALGPAVAAARGGSHSPLFTPSPTVAYTAAGTVGIRFSHGVPTDEQRP